MNEDVFNMELRKFLKQVGVTSQREIEAAVRKALDEGRLKGDQRLTARARISIDALGLEHEIETEISLA
jgi:hypothetical protein